MQDSRKQIKPFSYNGTLIANTSKSYLQRAMAIGLLANGKTKLEKINWANDTNAVHQVIQQLGAKTIRNENNLEIIPNENRDEISGELNVGESGLALRMFSAIITHYKKEILLTGEGSLLNRPVDPIVETIKKAGAQIKPSDGGLPLLICGPLRGGTIEIDGSFSSQILTGLLLTLPLLDTDTELHVKKPTSKPYLDMTLDIMSHFGVHVSHEAYEIFSIKGNQKYIGRAYNIEGDWSGAANHLVGAAMSGNIKLIGLNPISSQADRAILDVLKLYGATLEINEDSIFVEKNLAIPFEFDATQCPDLFPPIVALAASCVGDSVIKGTNRLLHKESNRLETLIATFKQLGVRITPADDMITIHGTGKVNGGRVSSFNDHRIAMVAAICATISSGDISIDEADAVNKSYPNFFEDLQTVSKFG